MGRRRRAGRIDLIDHRTLLEMLSKEFPEVVAAFDEYHAGLLHCEMGTFARLTEEAMDEGRFWQVQKYFTFIEKVREQARPEVENAIDVSYIEYLAFGEVTDNRLQAMRAMPKALRTILMEIDGRRRWA